LVGGFVVSVLLRSAGGSFGMAKEVVFIPSRHLRSPHGFTFPFPSRTLFPLPLSLNSSPHHGATICLGFMEPTNQRSMYHLLLRGNLDLFLFSSFYVLRSQFGVIFGRCWAGSWCCWGGGVGQMAVAAHVVGCGRRSVSSTVVGAPTTPYRGGSGGRGRRWRCAW